MGAPNLFINDADFVFATRLSRISKLPSQFASLVISWEYVAWHIEANRDCREAVDCDDYDYDGYYVR